MPRTTHPTLKTYEEFLAAMAKESEETKRYFFKQIEFAQKERVRKSMKDRRGYQRKKANAVAGTEPPADRPLPESPAAAPPG